MGFSIRASTIATIAVSFSLCCAIPAGAWQGKSKQNKQLASVDGASVTEAEVRAEGSEELAALELKRLRAHAAFLRDEHEILEGAVDRIVTEKMLAAEAAQRGMSKEDLIFREVDSKVTDPDEAEIAKFYETNKHRIRLEKEEALPEIGKYLRRQRRNAAWKAFLEILEKKHRVVRSMEPLRFDVKDAGRPALGPASAPVLLILFSDFECPYCGEMSDTLREVVKKYGKSVRLVFRNMPLPSIHPQALQAAAAGVCAAAQGRFWEMHDRMYRDQTRLAEKDLKDTAKQLGLDAGSFAKCLEGKQVAAGIDEDIRAGATAGVDSTPALFINGRFLGGSRPYEQIAGIIDDELERIKKKETSGKKQTRK